MGLKELAGGVLAEAKRLPWWAWLLIAAAVYLGYRLISQSGSQDTSGNPSDGGTLDTTSPVGEPTSGDPGNPLGDILGSPFPGPGSFIGNPIQWEDPGAPPDPGFPTYTSPHPDETAVHLSSSAFPTYTSPHPDETAVHISATTPYTSPHPDETYVHEPAVTSFASAIFPDETQIAQQIQPTYVAPTPPPTVTQNAYTTFKQQQLSTKPLAPTTTTNRLQTQYKRQIAAGIGGGPDTHRDQRRAGAQTIHRMRFGEDLYSVADRYGVSAEDIYQANREKIDSTLRGAGFLEMGMYALPVAGQGLDLVIPVAAA